MLVVPFYISHARSFDNSLTRPSLGLYSHRLVQVLEGIQREAPHAQGRFLSRALLKDYATRVRCL